MRMRKNGNLEVLTPAGSKLKSREQVITYMVEHGKDQ